MEGTEWGCWAKRLGQQSLAACCVRPQNRQPASQCVAGARHTASCANSHSSNAPWHCFPPPRHAALACLPAHPQIEEPELEADEEDGEAGLEGWGAEGEEGAEQDEDVDFEDSDDDEDDEGLLDELLASKAS